MDETVCSHPVNHIGQPSSLRVFGCIEIYSLHAYGFMVIFRYKGGIVMSSMTESLALFCEHRNPISDERAVVDGVEYAICNKCGLPIESTAIPDRKSVV